MSSLSAPATVPLPTTFTSGGSSTSVHSKLPDQPKREDLQILEYSTVVEPNQESLDSWGNVLHRVINAIVSIKGTSMRAFDTETAAFMKEPVLLSTALEASSFQTGTLYRQVQLRQPPSSAITRKSALSKITMIQSMILGFSGMILKRSNLPRLKKLSCIHKAPRLVWILKYAETMLEKN